MTKLERNHKAFMHLWNIALSSSPFFILFNHLYKHSYIVKSTSCPKVMFNLSNLWRDLYLHLIFFLYSLLFIWNVITQITLSLSSLQFFQTPLSKWTFACMLLFQLYFMVSASNDSVVKTESHSKAVIYLFYGLWYFVLASRNSKCLVT